jgi:hypothetical protein
MKPFCFSINNFTPFNTVYGQPQANLTGATIINPYGRGSKNKNETRNFNPVPLFQKL